MELIEEYRRQQQWRNWNQYLQHIPLSSDDNVLDLGCSVGDVSKLLSEQVNNVVGIDLDKDFISHCQKFSNKNEQFYCSDLSNFDYQSIGAFNGVWASFSLSYLTEPESFLASMFEMIEDGGWIALVDVSSFISGNLFLDSRFHTSVQQFEKNSSTSGIYDFCFGERMKEMLEQAGFRITYVDDNICDSELNFNGAASQAIIENWLARLNRLQGLKALLGNQYQEFGDDLVQSLSDGSHCMNECVRFVVAKKATE